MSNSKIRLKKSSVVGKVPSVGDLDHGELAINFADGIIYYKNSSNQISSFIDSDLINTAVDNKLANLTATDISYNNTLTGYVADNVQNAIDEIDERKLDISALASNVTYYSTDDSADVPGYFRLVTSTFDSDYGSTPVDISTGVIDSDNIFIASLVSDSATIIGETGFINVTTVGSVRRSAGIGSADFYYEIYKRDSTGTEELLTTSNTTTEVDVETYEQFSANALLPNTVFTEQDRVVLKYYGNRTSNFGSPEFEFRFEGTANSPTRTLFPVPVEVVPLTNVAQDILVDTSNFNGVLSGADGNVQSALDDIDDITTTDIPEGNNPYYSTTRFDSDFNQRLLSLTTDDIVEGSVNLYYTTTKVDSDVQDIVDSDYVQSLQIQYDVLDSAQTIALIDSAVTNLIDGAPGVLDTLNEISEAIGNDSDFIGTINNSLSLKLDTADFGSFFDTEFGGKSTTDLTEGDNLYYTSVRVDSDIISLVDSDYVQSRQITYDFLDSNEVIDLIDSDYVAARVPVTGAGATAYEEYYYTADSGQTVFTGLDDDSSGSLSYVPSLINVYLNGILLDSDEDYSASDGSTITLVNPTEDLDVVQVLSFTSDLQIAEYDYTASAAQTTITGLDNNSRALAYKVGYVEVYVNGVLLDPTLDYTATSGVSIVLNEPLALNDFVQVFALTQFKDEDPETPYRDFYFSVDSAGQKVLSGNDSDGDLLQYDVGAIKVFNNGVLMNPQTDYNAIDGVSVNFTSGLDSSDRIQIQSFERPEERPSFEEVTVSSGILVGGTNDSYRIDQYRNTTFTPTVEGESSAGTATYSTQVGQFVRVGNAVNFTLQVEWTGHTGTGNLLIKGLPFTSLNTGSLDYVFPVSTDGTITYTNYDNLISKMTSNSQEITLHTEDGAGNTGQLTVPSSGKVLITGQYFIE